MIELYGKEVEIYQMILIMYVIGWSAVHVIRLVSLFTGRYSQSMVGNCLDALWYGCIFILVGTLS